MSTTTESSASASTRVGFVGLGDIGRPMAQRLVAAGFPVTLHARRPASLEAFGDTVTVAGSMAELASGCDVIGLCVFADADVREVMTGDRGALAGAAPGTTILIHSTVHPTTCVELAAVAAEQGVHVLDAPISGGRDGAAAGRLVTLVGGDPAVLDASRPVLSAFSSEIIHLGPVGSGQIAKLLNNLMFGSQAGLVCDVLELAARLGVRDDAMLDVLEHASGQSQAATAFRRFGSFEDLLVVCQPLKKDLALVEELASPHGGVPAPIHDAAGRFARLL